jgi:hypothetical protein
MFYVIHLNERSVLKLLHLLRYPKDRTEFKFLQEKESIVSGHTIIFTNPSDMTQKVKTK